MAVQVEVSDDAVDVRLTGMDAVWSLRRSLRVVMADISSASVIPRDEALGLLGWRIGGTYLPGRAAAGRFTVRGRLRERAFCCLYRDPEVLAIETRRPALRHVVLQHADRRDLARAIAGRIA